MIVDVAEDPRIWEPFLALGERVYQGLAGAMPTLRADVQRELARPEFLGRQRVLAAVENGRVVARAAARLSPTLVAGGKPLGMLSVFEAEDSPAEVRELFDDACRWLRHRGARRVIGPLEGDAWHRAGLALPDLPAVDPPLFWGAPANPRYYPALWEGAGFQAAEHFMAREADVAQTAESLAPRAAEFAARGDRLRPIERARFRDELTVLHRLALEAWAGDPLRDAISATDFAELCEPLAPFLDPALSSIAEDAAGEATGYLLAVPDYQRAMIATRGRRGAVARWKFLLNRRHAQAVNVWSLAVAPRRRRQGIASSLVARMCQGALVRGLRKVNVRPEPSATGGLVDSPGWLGGSSQPVRRYVLYERGL